MEESKIRKLIMKHSVEYHECSKKGIYVNELYVDEFTDELIYELNQERAKANASTTSSGLDLQRVTVSLPELKKKLLSMRFTKKQMKECDQQGTFIAYGWTDCLNKLLEWVHKKGNAR